VAEPSTASSVDGGTSGSADQAAVAGTCDLCDEVILAVQEMLDAPGTIEVPDLRPLAQQVLDIARSCSEGTNPACASALETVRQAVADLTSCVNGPAVSTRSGLDCGTTVRELLIIVGGVVDLAVACVNGENVTCNAVVQLVFGAVATGVKCAQDFLRGVQDGGIATPTLSSDMTLDCYPSGALVGGLAGMAANCAFDFARGLQDGLGGGGVAIVASSEMTCYPSGYLVGSSAGGVRDCAFAFLRGFQDGGSANLSASGTCYSAGQAVRKIYDDGTGPILDCLEPQNGECPIPTISPSPLPSVSPEPLPSVSPEPLPTAPPLPSVSPVPSAIPSPLPTLLDDALEAVLGDPMSDFPTADNYQESKYYAPDLAYDQAVRLADLALKDGHGISFPDTVVELPLPPAEDVVLYPPPEENETAPRASESWYLNRDDLKPGTDGSGKSHAYYQTRLKGERAPSGPQTTYLHVGGVCSAGPAVSVFGGCADGGVPVREALGAAAAWMEGFASNRAHHRSGDVNVVMATVNAIATDPTANAVNARAYYQALVDVYRHFETVNNWARSRGVVIRFKILAGMDVEHDARQEYNTAAQTLPWLQEYNRVASGQSSPSIPLWNDSAYFGSCSQASCWNSDTGGGWTPAQMYHANWGLTMAYPFPQHYSKGFGSNWARLNRAAAAMNKTPMTFPGVMWGCKTGNTPDAPTAYSQFSAETGQRPRFLTRLHDRDRTC